MGNPSRGGTAPAPSSSVLISASLSNKVFIYYSATKNLTSFVVQMGPFSANSFMNLYATQEARQAGPTPPGLLLFPAFNPSASDLVF